MREVEPGRELDAIVAQQVLGWEVAWRDKPNQRHRLWRRQYNNWDGGGRAYYNIVPEFSGELQAAWIVVKRLYESGWKVTIQSRASGWACDALYPLPVGCHHVRETWRTVEEANLPCRTCDRRKAL